MSIVKTQIARKEHTYSIQIYEHLKRFQIQNNLRQYIICQQLLVPSAEKQNVTYLYWY